MNIIGVSITRRYMVPHPYEYCGHELHIPKILFYALFTFYFIGGLAHIFPTYFLVFKSQDCQHPEF